MAKKSNRQSKNKQNVKQPENKSPKQPEFSEETERVFKRILRVMSWVVGTCFILIIILPEFNKPLLDGITQVLYYIGIINLLLFTLIELVADTVKSLLNRVVGQNTK